MDYYGSFIQSKTDIYSSIIGRYSNYSKEYISSKLDILYETGYINSEVSVSGWMVFVGPEVVKQIDRLIDSDLKLEQIKLLVAKCLVPREDINNDIIELISSHILLPG